MIGYIGRFDEGPYSWSSGGGIDDRERFDGARRLAMSRGRKAKQRLPVRVGNAWLRSALLAGLAFFTSIAGVAAASVAEAANAGSRTRLVLLGTGGGPVQSALRSQPANALIVDGKVYLIDVGNGALRQLAMAGYRVGEVEAVFITHNHFDHNADLGAFMAFDWAGGRKAPVDIVGPPGTLAVAEGGMAAFARAVELFTSENGSKPPVLGGLYRVHEGPPAGGEVFKDSRIKVTAVENTHFAAMPVGSIAYGRDRSYSYRIETPDRVIVFSGDTGVSPALTKLAEGADILVSEVADIPLIEDFVNHLPSSEVRSEAVRQSIARHMVENHLPEADLGRMAAQAKVKTVVLTHYVPASVKNTDVFVTEVKKYFDGVVVAGVDLMAF